MSDPMPQIFNHCVDVYNEMLKNAPLQSIDGGPPRRIWEGFLTKLINEELGLAVPYYTSVRSNLVRMGCLTQLGRGGGTHPSTWELLKPPTEELFHAKGKVKSNSKLSILEQQVADHNRRLDVLEKLLRDLTPQEGN
jgi:hypothetical protein